MFSSVEKYKYIVLAYQSTNYITIHTLFHTKSTVTKSFV